VNRRDKISEKGLVNAFGKHEFFFGAYILTLICPLPYSEIS
jgi:hypothetical protein